MRLLFKINRLQTSIDAANVLPCVWEYRFIFTNPRRKHAINPDVNVIFHVINQQ